MPSKAANCWAASAPCPPPYSARAEASNSSAGRTLNDSGVHSAKESARLRAQDVGIGDGQVVTGDGQVQIIFEREVDGIFQRQAKLAVANQTVQAR